LSPFIIWQDIVAKHAVIERHEFHGKSTDHMPEVDIAGPLFTYRCPDPLTAHDLIAANVTTHSVIPQTNLQHLSD